MKRSFLYGATLAAGAIFVSGIVGCLPIGTGSDKPKPGELGNAVFSYECNLSDSGGDPYCDIVADTSAFPKIAVGGRFILSAETTDNRSLDTSTMVSASSSRIVSQGGRVFTALQPGVTSIMTSGDLDPAAKTDGNGHPKRLFLDYIDVNVVPAAGIALTEITVGPQGKVTSIIGNVKGSLNFGITQTYLRAQPIDANKDPVAGTLPDPYVWKSSNPQVVSVTMGASDHLVSIASLTSGTSTLTVTAGQLAASLDITVN